MCSVQLEAAVVAATRAERARKTRSYWPLRRHHGWQTISRVLEGRSDAIGKTALLPGNVYWIWDSIRRLYADTRGAHARITASRFSFTPRADAARHATVSGMQRIEMSFLPDVRCSATSRQTIQSGDLGILFKGKNVGEILAMSVEMPSRSLRSAQHPPPLSLSPTLG